jgi:transglutaminase-like putative cysteine protease
MLAGAALAVAVAAAGLVLAQGTGAPARPVLHEELPLLTGDKGTPQISRQGASGNPTAIVAGDKMLPKPSVDAKQRPGEPVLGTNAFAADRLTAMKPDDNTGPDNTLQYVSVFNPDVLPFKLMSSFDAVGTDETLHVERTVMTELPVGGTTDPRTRDRFYGDVLVQLKPGVDVPFPSVAPDMRILSYETKPHIQVRFSKDGADNFFVRSDEPNASGTYRLTFYADADGGYFAPQLPPRPLKVRDVIAAAPNELKPHIPPQVMAQAQITLSKLGVNDVDLDLGYAFNKLVGHFRAFQAGDIKHPTGDIYRDLCDSQAGVCRHRAFAFMITANALGIPTRYVQNEAHAFVEVWFPLRSWQRIDLGGAALRMNVSGADDKKMHVPRSEDPFMKPPEYKNQYTQLEGDITGLSEAQKADRKNAPPSGALGTNAGNAGTGGSAPGGASVFGTGSGGTASGPDRISPDPNLPVKSQDPRKPTPDLLVTQADTTAFRGDQFHVEGLVRVGGKGLANHRVNIFLAPAGRGGEGAIAIGHALTRNDGTFSTEVPVPPGIDLAKYEVRLSSDEDAFYNGTFSD